MARPPSADPRSKIVMVRLSASEHERLTEDAEQVGLPVSSYLRDRALRAKRPVKS